jgi:drug/metabolite transporter (DMT)-like permease
MTWFTFTLLSQLFLVISAFISKRFLNQSRLDPKIFGGLTQLLVGFIALPAALLTGFSFHLTAMSTLWFLLMVTIYVVGTSLYFVGLKYVDLSTTTILDSSTAVWTLLVGVFILTESITTDKLLGVILMVTAVILVSLDPHSFHLKLNKFELFLLLYSFMYAFGAALDNRLVTFSNAVSYMSLSFTCVGSILLLVNFRKLPVALNEFIHQKTISLTLLIISGLSFAAFYCIMHAYELKGEISSMMPIQQLNGVIIPIVGIIFLNERHKVPQKLIAAGLAFAGALLINH